MRWLDRHGRPMPLEEVFAEHLRLVKQRAQRYTADDCSVLTVRDHAGTRQHDGVEGTVTEPSWWHFSV